MSILNIAATRNTPAVLFDHVKSVYRVSGHSIPENAGDFYTPILDWLRANMPAIKSDTVFEFSLPYFNSSSLKALYLVLMEVKKECDKGKSIEVIWYVEEEDDFMSEAAETFTEMVGIPLTLKSGHIDSSEYRDVA